MEKRFDTQTVSEIRDQMNNAKFEPDDGKVILFIGQDLNAVGGVSFSKEESGWGRDGSSGYLNDDALPVPAGITTYTNVSNQGLWSHIEYGAGDYYLDHQLSHEALSNKAISIGYWMLGDEGAITAGARDTELIALAEYFKQLAPRPIFFRIGYEFNFTGYDPAVYRTAFIHIWELMKREGVSNVAYVWQSNGNEPISYNYEPWYPGDRYVDWVGYSHFSGMQSAGAAYGEAMIAFGKAHDKPIMIAEACANNVDFEKPEDTSKAREWFDMLWRHLDLHPEIKALAYISVDWKNQAMWKSMDFWKKTDSRIEINEEIKKAWIDQMQQKRWILGNDSLYQKLKGHSDAVR
ncbi:MAG: glycosyl hydrolase [Fibrobacterales bacterium]